MKVMKILVATSLLFFISIFGFSQELIIQKENYKRKEIRAFNSLTKAQKKTTLVIVNSQLEWIDSSAKSSITITDRLSSDQVDAAKTYVDLGILPAVTETTYYAVENSSKILRVPSVTRKEIELKSALNIK